MPEIIIKDGTGTSRTTRVNRDNQLEVAAIVSTQEHYTNHVKGEAYNIVSTATAPTSGTCFFYIKNESDYKMSLEGIWLKIAGDDYIDIKLNDMGTPVGGTAVTPVNLNTDSGRSAEGVFLNNGPITGISGGQTAYRIYHASAFGSLYHNFNQDIVLGKNGVFTVYSGIGGIQIDAMVEFNYDTTNMGI